ncbi:MAG: hypothetical protein Q9170_002592 [Blastenia crenularia]
MKDLYQALHIPCHSRTINLQGLDYGYPLAIDFYQPIIRDYRRLNNIHHPAFIEPLDTVTVWKQLTLSDCEALFFIQTYLKVCLEWLLEEQFLLFRARLLDACQTNWQESDEGLDCMETWLSHRFLFHRAQLTQAMSRVSDTLGESPFSESGSRSAELLMLYLWSRDCFIDLPHRSGQTAVDARLRCYVGSAACFLPSSTIEVLSTPDYLCFERLDVLPQEGSELIIKPSYRTNAPYGPRGPHTKVTYSLGSNYPWLGWDNEFGAFRGRLPIYSQSSDTMNDVDQVCLRGSQGRHAAVHVLKVVVKALVVMAYPGSKTCLERIIRVRLTIKVLPPASTARPSKLPTYPSQLHKIRPDPTESKNNEALNAGVDGNPPLKANTRRLHQTNPMKSEVFASTGNAESRVSSHRASTDVPSAPNNKQALKMLLPMHKDGLKRYIHRYPLSSSSRKKAFHTYRDFSNLPRTDLRTLAEIQSRLNEPVLGEADPSYCSKRGLLDSLATKGNRYDAGAEAFDARYNRRSSKKMKRERLYANTAASRAPNKSNSQKIRKSSLVPAHKVLGMPPQTMLFFNRYAPLRGLSQNSRVKSLSDESDLSLPRPRLTRSKQTHRHPDSGCYSEDVFLESAKKTTDLGEQGVVSITDRACPTKSRGGEMLKLQKSNKSKPSPVSQSKISTIGPTHANSKHYASLSLSQDPIGSSQANHNADGGDPYTDRHRRAMWSISTMKEAVEAFREPGLSKDERGQKFEAMMKTLETNSTSRNSSGMMGTDVAYEVTEVELDSETNDSTATGSEEDPNEEI